MEPDGKLYVPGAELIRPALAQLTRHAHQRKIRIVASADDHVPGHRELSDHPDFKETFPPHCMRDTAGQGKIPETRLDHPLVIEPHPIDPQRLRQQVQRHAGDLLFHKHWFDVFSNPNVETVLAELSPRQIVVYGVATDVCNRYAIEGLLTRHPQIQLFAVTDAMKPIDAGREAALLADWHRRGVRLVPVTDALRLA